MLTTNTGSLHSLILVGAGTKTTNIVGIGKSWILNVHINPELKRSDFDEVTSEVKKNAYQPNDSLWDAYRYKPLTEKENKTYKVIDSIGEANHFDRMFGFFETLMTGYLKTHFFNIRLNSLIDYNDYEGLRLGIGGKTKKIS